jgi:hypothetical protein
VQWEYVYVGGRLRLIPVDPDKWEEWRRNLELRRRLASSPKAIMELAKLRRKKVK